MEQEEQPTINLTPLVDVVFVVLIMFIVIAPLLEIDRVELPSAPALPEAVSFQESSSLQIVVKKDNTVWIDQVQIPLPHLPERLKTWRRTHEEATPQVLQDKHSSFGTYQEVKNALEWAGFETMDVVVAPS